MIDTHTHLYDEAFDADRHEVIDRALGAGVTTMILPAIDSRSHDSQEQLAVQYPQHLRQMMGLHPTSVDDHFEDELSIVQKRLFSASHSPYIAIGEIGLDLYWDTTYVEQQREALVRQLQWATALDLPVCLHVRKAYNELFGILRKLNRSHYRGVMHCFGGSLQEAYKAIEMGFYLGVGGVATFKNATLGTIAATIPLERIVLETDAPYLTPVPYRGKRNESAYLPIIATHIAAMRNISFEEVDRATTQNAKTLFRID